MTVMSPHRHPPACPGAPSPHGAGSGPPNKPGDDGRGVTAWTRVGTLEEVPRLGSRVVRTRREDIVIFRTADDRVFAMHDRCPHKQGKLSQGIVHGTSVTCPLHNWVIGLDDGIRSEEHTSELQSQ